MWKREAKESVSEGFEVRKSQRAIVDLEDGRGSPAKDCWQPLETGRGKEMDYLFPKASRINTSLPTPWYYPTETHFRLLTPKTVI